MDLFSDHNLLFFDFNLFAKLSSSDTRSVLDYCLADWPGLYRTLLSINLSPSITLNQINNMSTNSNPGDINKDWESWCDRFMDAVHHHIPTKIIKKRTSPWLDSETHHLLHKKETARRKAKKSCCSNNLWENFRNLRRSCKSLISRKRKEFFQSAWSYEIKHKTILVVVQICIKFI
jgi:hypothetical protein